MRMHRLITIAATGLIAGTATVASAQGLQPVDKQYSFGILAGVNLATMAGNDVSNVSNRTGFVGGLSTWFRAYEQLGFEADLLYAQKGAKGTGAGVTGTLQHDYIEVPLLARFDFTTSSEKVRPFLALGPSFGYSVRCRVEATSGGVSASASCADAGLDENKFDVGGTAGAGLGFPMGRSTFTVGARYTYGFTNVEKTYDAKNRVWSFLAGLSW